MIYTYIHISLTFGAFPGKLCQSLSRTLLRTLVLVFSRSLALIAVSIPQIRGHEILRCIIVVIIFVLVG